MGLLDRLKKFAEGTPAETITEDSPGTPELFARGVAALLASDTQTFITISGLGDTCVQVAKGGDILSLNVVPYPFADDPHVKLPELGIMLPDGSTIQAWEAQEFCQCGVPVSATAELAVAINSIFLNLYGAADGYTVGMYLEN